MNKRLCKSKLYKAQVNEEVNLTISYFFNFIHVSKLFEEPEFYDVLKLSMMETMHGAGEPIISWKLNRQIQP